MLYLFLPNSENCSLLWIHLMEELYPLYSLLLRFLVGLFLHNWVRNPCLSFEFFFLQKHSGCFLFYKEYWRLPDWLYQCLLFYLLYNFLLLELRRRLLENFLRDLLPPQLLYWKYYKCSSTILTILFKILDLCFKIFFNRGHHTRCKYFEYYLLSCLISVSFIIFVSCYCFGQNISLNSLLVNDDVVKV